MNRWNCPVACSRLGGTAAFRLSTHQSIRVSCSGGIYIRFGRDYQNISVA
jgi:hypothetical protein